MDDAPETMVLFPEGTTIHEPNEENEVVIVFPTQSDAIIFHEFLRSFSLGEIKLETVS